MARENRHDLLEIIRNLRPKEYADMTQQIEELLNQLDPKEQARLESDWIEAIKKILPRIASKNPEEIGKILEAMLKDLTPEQRKRILAVLQGSAG